MTRLLFALGATASILGAILAWERHLMNVHAEYAKCGEPTPMREERVAGPGGAAGISRLRRGALIAVGGLCVALGTVGIVVPGLPTTCFVLAASFCFAGSSPRLHAWLLRHRWFGPYLRMARERRMPLRAKIVSLLLMWAGIAFACVVTDSHGWAIQATIVAAGLVGTGVVVFGLRTASTRALSHEAPAGAELPS
jgi:hypothetical protein